jgi:hypothetical protein
MGAPTRNDMATPSVLTNKRERASIEPELANDTPSRNAGNGVTTRAGVANRSVGHPSKRLKVTKNTSASDVEVEPLYSLQDEGVQEEYAQDRDFGKEGQDEQEGDSDKDNHLNTPKPAKGNGNGKAAVQLKNKRRVTDPTTNEEDTEEDLAMPKPTKGKDKKQSGSKKKKNKDGEGYTTPPDADLRALVNGIKTLQDWTCSTIEPDKCKLIAWFDRDELRPAEIARKYTEDLGHGTKQEDGSIKIVSNTAIYKVYDENAPTFYRRKGFVWAIRNDRKKFVKAEQRRVAGLPPKVNNPKPDDAKTRKVKGSDATCANGERNAKSATTKSIGTQFNLQQLGTQAVPQVSATISHLQANQATEDINHQSSDSDSNEEGEEVIMPRLTQDQQLEILFAQQPVSAPAPAYAPTSSASAGKLTFHNKKSNKSKPTVTTAATTTSPCPTDIARYFANRNSADVLHFKHTTGDALLGHPSRPILALTCATQYSQYLFAAVEGNPELQLIEYEDSIQDVTIARYVACVAPSLRQELPSYDIVELDKGELRVTQIQWSMQELKDLYEFARTMGAWDVIDMVMDRIHVELHRAIPRTTINEFGEEKSFDVLDFTPEFLTHLAKVNDTLGLDFFTDVIVAKGQDGFNHLSKYGLEAWSENVKKLLIGKLQSPTNPMVSVTDADFICASFHHHHEHNWGCYKDPDPAAPMLEPASDQEPGSVAKWWKRVEEMEEIITEKGKVGQTWRSVQGSKMRKRSDAEKEAIKQAQNALKHLVRKRKKADEALEDEEDAMVCIKLSCFVEPEYELADTEPDEDEIAPTPAVQEQPAFPGGLVFPKHLGNGTKDSERMQVAKMAMVKEKLMMFKAVGIDIGDVELDVEMSEEGEEEDGSGDGDDEEGAEEENSDEEESASPTVH